MPQFYGLLGLRQDVALWQIRLSDPAQYQSIVEAEWNIIYEKLDRCAESGAKIVLSRLAIGDLATQYFADRDIFCAGRVRRTASARQLIPEFPGWLYSPSETS